jgi:predicted ribosomally synthesized peptide with nif11-like leader
MSIQEARDFLAKLESDEALAEQADDAYVSALLTVAQGAGFEIAEKDLRAALDQGSGELPDEALDKVAGGAGNFDAVTGLGNFNTADSFNTANNLFGGFSSFSPKGFQR